jgi:hypothetical protein
MPEIFHSILWGHGLLWVSEIAESKTADKGELYYFATKHLGFSFSFKNS